jgi:hypothetical protein
MGGWGGGGGGVVINKSGLGIHYFFHFDAGNVST